MPHGFAHMELNTDNAPAAAKFYKSLFAWKTSGMRMGTGDTYIMVDTGPRQLGGGIQKKPSPQTPTAWLPYVEVESVKRSIAKAKKLGARIMVEYQPIDGMGAYGVFTDPTGATMGVWERAKKPARRTARRATRRATRRSTH